jgi:hypothetical protein
MAPIILLRLPATARLIRARDGRQAIGARLLPQVVRVSGKEVVRISGTRRVARLFIGRMASNPQSVVSADMLARFQRLFGQMNSAVERLATTDRAPFR